MFDTKVRAGTLRDRNKGICCILVLVASAVVSSGLFGAQAGQSTIEDFPGIAIRLSEDGSLPPALVAAPRAQSQASSSISAPSVCDDETIRERMRQTLSFELRRAICGWPSVPVATTFTEETQVLPTAQPAPRVDPLNGLISGIVDPSVLASQRLAYDLVVDKSLATETIEQTGVQVDARRGSLLSITATPEQLLPLIEQEGVRSITPVYVMTHAGSVNGEGSPATRADAFSWTGLDGTGVNLGILSDSYDCLSGAATGVASGDLPSSGVTVLQDYIASGCTDEGRGIAEIVHDMVPSSGLAFHTAFGGEAVFAQGIEDLAGLNPGSGRPQFDADVIVDDVSYFTEPWFQDGVVAQAVANVVANGVDYFSSAGNAASQSYERDFVASSFRVGLGGGVVATMHDFDPGAAEDTWQSITLQSGSTLNLWMQWDEPAGSAGGASNTKDMVILYRVGTTISWQGDFTTTGGDPVEVIQLTYSGTGSITFDIGIGVKEVGGVPPVPIHVKYNYYRSGAALPTINEYATNSGTVMGHANAVATVAVGASFYGNTPAFGTSPATLESFSSSGGVLTYFDTAGNRFTTPVDRMKPDLVGPDGINNTFFGSPDTDGDGNPNFYGTSASAPILAAVAALMRQANSTATNSELRTCLTSTAEDMGPAGFDYSSGYGYVDAEQAIECHAYKDFGDDPSSYGDASHLLLGITTTDDVYIGTIKADNESGSQPSSGADGDGADEDGVSNLKIYDVGSTNTGTLDVVVTNNTSLDGQLVCWIDWNQNGVFTDAGERSSPALSSADSCLATSKSTDNTFTTGNVPASCSGATTLFWTGLTSVPAVNQTVYTRCRITNEAGGTPNFFSDSSPEPTDLVTSGEVEDDPFDIPPTHATIGKVTLSSRDVTAVLQELISGLDDTALYAILTSWAPQMAASLGTDVDRQLVIDALPSYLDPDGDGQVAVLRWETLEERGTIGFFAERREQTATSWYRINESMLPALIDAPLGGEYWLADPEATSGVDYVYRLIEQEAWGTQKSYGPYSLRMN